MAGLYFNAIKAIYDKPMANIIMNMEKWKASPWWSGIRQGDVCSHHSPSIYVKFELEQLGKKKRMKEKEKEYKW